MVVNFNLICADEGAPDHDERGYLATCGKSAGMRPFISTEPHTRRAVKCISARCRMEQFHASCDLFSDVTGQGISLASKIHKSGDYTACQQYRVALTLSRSGLGVVAHRRDVKWTKRQSL
jgi:hypothetical protein